MRTMPSCVPSFGAAAMARAEPRVRAFAEQAVAGLPMGQPVDLMPPYALSIPASVIGDLLGLDPALHSRLKRLNRVGRLERGPEPMA